MLSQWNPTTLLARCRPRNNLLLLTLVIATAFHAFTHGLSGTAHLYVPLMTAPENAEFSFVFTNPTLASAVVTLTARTYSGEPITGEGVSNPATITLLPLARRAVKTAEVSGAGIAGRAGWIEAIPSYRRNPWLVSGLRFRSSLHRRCGPTTITGFLQYEVLNTVSVGLAGFIEYGATDGHLLSAAPVQAGGFSDMFFSHIAEGDGFYSGMALLNPTLQAASVTIGAFDGIGQRIDSAGLQLGPGTHRAGLLQVFF